MGKKERYHNRMIWASEMPFWRDCFCVSFIDVCKAKPYPVCKYVVKCDIKLYRIFEKKERRGVYHTVASHLILSGTLCSCMFSRDSLVSLQNIFNVFSPAVRTL